MMSDAELGELAKDIQENGLQQPIIILRDNTAETLGESGPYPMFLLDGRNRLEALKRSGITDPSKTPGGALYSQKVRVIDLHMQTTLGRGAGWEAVLDPVTFVLSMNVKRRHLTREQKRAILAASIKAEPALSDRQHAKRAGVSDKTAGAVRRELESTAEIPQSDSRVSGDGRTRRKPEKNNVVELSPDEVVVRNRGGKKLPKSAQWPHCVAPPERYDGLYRPRRTVTAKRVVVPEGCEPACVSHVDGTTLIDIDFDSPKGDKSIGLRIDLDTAWQLADFIMQFVAGDE